jgi:hypothetical protein
MGVVEFCLCGVWHQNEGCREGRSERGRKDDSGMLAACMEFGLKKYASPPLCDFLFANNQVLRDWPRQYEFAFA